MYTAYGIVTLYEWPWWFYSIQLSLSTCVLYDHHGYSYTVMIPYALYIRKI
jgi:hypothetical protein